MEHPLAASVLVGVAAGLTVVCSVGMAAATNALERLHYVAPVTSISAGLIMLAVWLDDPAWQSKLKVTLVAAVLFLMNAILSHSTGRALRIREMAQVEKAPKEDIPLLASEDSEK